MWDPVRLGHYDPRWRQEFEQSRSSILQAGEGWVTAVEHVGSTAVPGLIAAPIVDMVAGVLDAICLVPAAERLEGLNYRSAELPSWACDQGQILIRPRMGTQTHVVYLTVFDGPLWKRLVAVRDRLRQNAMEAGRYEDAKVHRWRISSGNPRLYLEGKSCFFTHLEEQMSAAHR
jgi:GrpB-like predicted nucleotidyltransferase (UPF0157 family)